MHLRKWWMDSRQSLWFVPMLCVVASALLAFAMVGIDRLTPDLATAYPLVFGGGAEGARGLLSSIAGSMISVAGLTFSITLVALQLASSQYSPRVLRTFTADRVNQLVLGSFLGAFTYAILVLRSIRSGRDGGTEFVPALAVGVAILIALLAIFMLVYFIHHIATRIQASTIVENIADETLAQLRQWPEATDSGVDEVPSAAPGAVLAAHSGHLQLVDARQMVAIATEFDLVLRVDAAAGDWVQRDTPLFSVWPPSGANETLGERLNRSISMGAQRSIEQDVAFGIRQLVDVALKAISPSINDPTTATDCIHRIGRILVEVGQRHHPPTQYRDEEGRLRVVVPQRGWDDLVAISFDQIRQYAVGSTDVMIALAGTLRTIAVAVRADRHPALHRQARLIREVASEIEPEVDRQRVVAEIDAAIAARPAGGAGGEPR